MTKAAENLTPLAHTAQNRCFGCGHANPAGLHLEGGVPITKSSAIPAAGKVYVAAEIPDTFEGHPGYLHGGIIATLIDETMSKAVRARGFTAMTRHMEVDYLRPVPSGKPLRLGVCRELRVSRHRFERGCRWKRAIRSSGRRLLEPCPIR